MRAGWDWALSVVGLFPDFEIVDGVQIEAAPVGYLAAFGPARELVAQDLLDAVGHAEDMNFTDADMPIVGELNDIVTRQGGED